MDKILIIEDDPDIAAIERDYLELSGCAVTICANGTDGQRAALEGAFDLILLDLMLPGTDGFFHLPRRARTDGYPHPHGHGARQGRRQDPRPRLRRGRLHRKALVARVKANPAHPQLLQTVWGVGYRLRKDNEPS